MNGLKGLWSSPDAKRSLDPFNGNNALFRITNTMTDQHPITPPPELVTQWFLDAKAMPVDQWVTDVATQAARWGADQELEACCKWLPKLPPWSADDLRRYRRPKPPSLKEQALKAVQNIDDACEPEGFSKADDTDIIRRALEQLKDD